MNSEWQSHLTQLGAVIEGTTIQHFGNTDELAALPNANIMTDLSAYGLISVQGADAETFLQGQLTNDIRLVTAQQSQLSAYCSPKGRMLASMRIFKRDTAYYLELPVEILEPVLKRLRMFVLRSQVTLNDVSDELIRIGVSGPDIEQHLHKHFTALPAETDQSLQQDAVSLIRIAGPVPRFEVHGPLAQIRPLWDALQTELQPVGTPAWLWLDTVAGIPQVLTPTIDAFVPQMANLHSLGGVSFKKGCYTGQEVVARMHYLGKLKRRMYRAHVATDALPQPGDSLYGADSGDEQSAGKVVFAVPAPGGGVDLLAVLQITSVEKGPVHLQSAGGPQLEFMDLPYDVTNEA